MRNLIILFLILSCTIGIKAQDLNNLYKAIGKGDVNTVFSYMDTKLDLCIYDDQTPMRREEAKDRLIKFFADIKPQSYTHKHSGTSRANSNFYIGELASSKGSLRVYIYMTDTSQGQKIKELRFDKS